MFGFKTRALRRGLFVALAAIGLITVGQAGEVRLRNGTSLSGNLWLLSKLSDTPTGISKRLVPIDAMPNPQNIVLVDNGWQKYYVPRRQIPDEDVDRDLIPSNPQTFVFKPLKTNQSRMIATVGSVIDVTPFDDFGHRTITLASQKGKLDVIQAISRIEPDHVVLEALNYNWQVGASLKSVPNDVLNKLIRQKVKADDAVGRFGLVRFFMQAEMYQDAFGELDAITKDFPDQASRADVMRSELMNLFGREVLLELNRRKAAGQHQMAYDFATKLISQKIGGALLDDVRKFLRDYEEAVKSIERTKILLADWQAKLDKAEVLQQLQPFRAEINEQLNLETLPRLDAFLKAESDKLLTAEQRLALAYSGWVVGAENSITDLNLAMRYWDARFTMLEAVRADTIQDRDMHAISLQRVEGVGPRVVMQLAAYLPQILDAGEAQPFQVHRVQANEGTQNAVTYSVMLPPEYSPFHTYPLLVALRGREQSCAQTLQWWGGSIESPGPAMRRGYIVIAPEYAEDRQSEYAYSTSAHQTVIESLRDARKRYNIDSNRVFLAGHGMGADAAFDVGMSHPDEFAGVIPIGGECQHYPKVSYLNGRYTSWYVIGRGYNTEARDAANPAAQRDPSNNGVFDEIFKRGFQFDFILVEYLGRGIDRYHDEVPKLFEWMDLHRRRPPPKDFDIVSLRKTDNRHFWVTAVDLPWTVILPPPAGAPSRISPMEIKPIITEGNKIRVESPAKKYIIRLGPDSIDFEKRVEITRAGRRLFFNFVTPDSTAILNELRATGDRTRLPLATLEVQ
jgi:enterochelin esterase-like enzyme